MPLSETLSQLLSPLETKREELLTIEARLSNELDDVRGELKVIDRITKMADPNYGKHKNGSKPGKKSGGKSTGIGVGADTLKEVIAWIKKQPTDREFEQIELRRAIDSIPDNASSTTAPLFQFMRDENFIRFVAKRGPRKFYAVTGAEPSPAILERAGISEG